MATDREIIPGIKEVLLKELKNLKLSPSIPINDAIRKKRRWYTSPCLDKNKKKVLFKGVICAECQNILAHEIGINRLFKKINIYKNLNTQKIVNSKISKKITWIMLEYLEGKPCGIFFDIVKGADSLELVAQYAQNISSLQKISMRNSRTISKNFKKHSLEFFIKNLKGLEDGILAQIPRKDYNVAIKILKKNERLLSKNLVLTHGDASFGNHIYGRNKKIYLIDWEKCHFNNMAYDIVFLWTQGWKKPEWKKKLIEKYTEICHDKTNFNKIFPLMALYFLLREIGLWSRAQTMETKKWYIVVKNKITVIDPTSIQSQDALISHKKNFYGALKSLSI